MWDKLTTTALLGTGRSILPDDLQQALKVYGIDPESDPEKALLSGAAVLLRQRQASPVLNSGETQQWSAPDLSTERPCSAAAEKLLAQIMNGPFLPALPEFLQLATFRNLHVPPAWLPALLDMALRDATIHSLLQNTGGPRAAWLISLNPRWNSAGRSTRRSSKATITALSDADFNATALEYLALQRDLENGHPMVKMMSTPGYRWSDELVNELVANFFRWLERRSFVHVWVMQHYLNMLLTAAYGCDSVTCKVFETTWPANAPSTADFNRILAFRRELLGAFE